MSDTCPFCGSDQIEHHCNEGREMWRVTWEPVTYCEGCGIAVLTGNYGMGGFTKEMALERHLIKWRSRANAGPLVQEVQS